MASTAVVKVIKNKTGFMLTLLLMMLMGVGPAVAKTEPGDKKEKASTEKKKNKLVAVKKNKKVFADYWCFISNNTTPSTQVINGSPVGSLPGGGDCQQTNTGDICATKLSWAGTPPSMPSGTTVQQAVDSYGATIVTVGGNRVYAKHPVE